MQTNEEASNSSSQWEESATGEKDTDALAAEEERRTLARKENQAIKWLRASVFVILLAATALVASFTFIYMYQDQKQDFLDDFRAAASRVIESFQTTMGRKVEGLNSMASVYTSYAIAQGSTWPNVTLPDYEIRAASARIMADVVLMNMYTIVTDEDRLGWEAFYRDAYLAKFAAFLEEETVQRDEQDERMGQRRLQYENRTIKSRNPDGSLYPAPPGDGPYVTCEYMRSAVALHETNIYCHFTLSLLGTQSSPISGEQVGLYMMYNALTNPGLAGPLNRTIHSKKCVFGLSNNYETKEEGNKIPRDYMKLILSLGQYRNNNEELHLDPITSIYHPIFDTFDVATRKPVGALLGTMYWKYYFKNILPPNVKGIYCVLRNTANQTLTYRIDGTEVVYIGYGDFHDPKYDDLEENIVVSSYLQNRASVETMSYSAVEIDFDFLDYKLSVYPSQATEDVYVNKSPLLFTIVVIGVFCFTSVVFVVYDTMVAKRQQIVMNRAVASGAIVSSLFPSQVRDELYKEKEPIGPEDEGGFEMDKLASKPKKIAQVYPNTTILFADLAGFTQWSSSRDPEQVFELLESIYQKFDSIAARRRVFKVRIK